MAELKFPLEMLFFSPTFASVFSIKSSCTVYPVKCSSTHTHYSLQSVTDQVSLPYDCTRGRRPV